MKSAKISQFLLLIAISLLAFSQPSAADPKQVAKIRKFYRDHNLDFFSDLISDQKNFDDDEKKHAKLELLADDARVKALNQLEKLMKNASPEMRSEFLVRKASLLADRAKTAFYFQNNPIKTSAVQAPKIYLDQSIKTFMQVEKQFPHHPKMDVVLFSVAYNYQELKQVDPAFSYYQKLVTKFNESPLVGDARLAMAEILFDKRKFNDSLTQLKAIVASEHPRLKNFALYKMAWTYYNLADLDSAMHSLEKVIEGVNQSNVGQAKLELRKEALHDLVNFYAEKPEGDAPAKALSYFDKIAQTPNSILQELAEARKRKLAALAEKKQLPAEEDHESYRLNEAKELLLRLVQVYRDQGKHQNAVVVAEQLIQDLKKHPRAVALYRIKAESYEKLRQRDKVIQELQRLAQVLQNDLKTIKPEKELASTKVFDVSKYFASIQLKDQNYKTTKNQEAILAPSLKDQPDAFKENYYEKNLFLTSFETFKDFCQFYHGEFSKTNNSETAKHALTAYQLLVQNFINNWKGHSLESLYDLRFQRAQLFYSLKDYLAASDDFEWLLLHYPANKNRNESVRANIAALEEEIKSKQIAINPPKFSDVHQRLARAYDYFLTFHLFDEKEQAMTALTLSTSGRLYKEHQASQEALNRMLYYSKFFANEKDAQGITSDILVILEKDQRWEELRDFTNTLIDKKQYQNTKLFADLKRSNEYATLRLLEVLEKTKDWKKAQKEFAEFAKKFSDSSFASQALLKSARAALELKDDILAIESLEKATLANDDEVKKQAWLALEPFYQKTYHWFKLKTLYDTVVKLKLSKEEKIKIEKNVATLKELETESFKAKANQLIEPDQDLNQTLATFQAFEPKLTEYKQIQFVKSNNNPAQNFKKKADAQSKLVKDLEKTVDKTHKKFKNLAVVWANILKAEIILDFAQTLTQAALPKVLLQATENDRKSYVDTLANQANDLVQSAQKLIKDTAQQFANTELAFYFNDRLNRLLEQSNNSQIFELASPKELWSQRPKMKSLCNDFAKNKNKSLTQKTLNVIEKKSTKEVQEALFELAEFYAENCDLGYALATATAVAEAKSEFSGRANRMIILLNFSRLPVAITNALDQNNLSIAVRWDLARFIASQKVSEDSFNKSEVEWFKQIITPLLKPRLSENHRKLSSEKK